MLLGVVAEEFLLFTRLQLVGLRVAVGVVGVVDLFPRSGGACVGDSWRKPWFDEESKDTWDMLLEASPKSSPTHL